jgi:hydroxyacylglutathione hydrolase
LSKQEMEQKLKVDDQLRVRIPEKLAEKYGIIPNSEIFLSDVGKGIEMRSMNPPSKISDSITIVGGLGTSYQWDAVEYLIRTENNWFMVDCGSDLGFTGILENLKKSRVNPSQIDRVLLTHSHWDHAAGGAQFSEKLGIPIYANVSAKAPIEEGDPDRTLSQAVFGRDFPKFSLTGTFSQGEVVEVENVALEVIDLPGHCPDNTGFYGEIDNRKVCFTGDMAGLHSPRTESSVEDSIASLEKLKNLDIDLMLHGHRYFTKSQVRGALEYWEALFMDKLFAYMYARFRGT